MLCIFLFYSKRVHPLSRWLHPEFQHVEFVRATSKGNTKWVVFTLAKNGVGLKHMDYMPLSDFIEQLKLTANIAHIVVTDVYKSVNNHPWVMLPNCNEVARCISNIDIGFTLTPYHLFKKLLAYDNIRNYSVIVAWSRKNGNK